MTPYQASLIIGCSTSTVKQMIRDKRLVAVERKIPGGWYYEISQEEAERVRDLPKTELRGKPRGYKHNSKGAK